MGATCPCLKQFILRPLAPPRAARMEEACRAVPGTQAARRPGRGSRD